MGKKNKGNKAGKKGADPDDGLSDNEIDGRTITGSVDGELDSVFSSSMSIVGGKGTPGVGRSAVISIDISEATEMLSEKRYSTRERGLEALIKHFQTSYEDEADLSIEGYQDSITSQLLRLIRRPNSVKEGKLCTHLLCLIGLYLGPDEDEFFDAFVAPLQLIVDSASDALLELRGAALECLVLLSYICGGIDASYRTWNYCRNKLVSLSSSGGGVGTSSSTGVTATRISSPPSIDDDEDDDDDDDDDGHPAVAVGSGLAAVGGSSSSSSSSSSRRTTGGAARSGARGVGTTNTGSTTHGGGGANAGGTSHGNNASSFLYNFFS